MASTAGPPPTSSSSSSSPQYTYAPPPAELPYYNGLFAAADKSSSGYLSGPSAVEFFFLSKLPIDLLKQIWTMADQPPSNTLNPTKFYVAVRLIQLFQNGKKPIDAMLNVNDVDRQGMRAPFFEGVDVQAAMAKLASQQQQQPKPPQPQQQQQYHMQQQQQGGGGGGQTMTATTTTMPTPTPLQPALISNNIGALAVQDSYTMTPQELSRYEALFPSYAKPDEGGGSGSYVGGAAAVELFGKSGMDRESLKTIWAMVDDPVDNKLDSIEFSVAMHLIVCVTKKGLSTPPTLPESLKNMVKYYRAQRAQANAQANSLQQQQAAISGGPSVMGGVRSMVTPPPLQQQQQQQQQPPPLVGGGQPEPIPSPLSSPTAHGGMGNMQKPQMNGGGMGDRSGDFGAGFGGIPLTPTPSSTNLIPTPRMSNEPLPMLPQLGGTQQQQQQQQQQQYMQPPPQQQYMQPQTPGQQQQYMQQTQISSGMSQLGYQQQGVPRHQQRHSLGGGSVIDEAFAGLSNNPVQDVDEYSATGSNELYTPITPGKTQQQLPPKSPKSPKVPSISAFARAPSTGSVGSVSGEDLCSLRAAHQKLLAEVISLRAKAANVSDEEFGVQQQIKATAMEIGKLSLELSALKESVMEAKVKLGASVGILKTQMGMKESLEAQIAEARTTHNSLADAAAAVEDANELAMNYAAKAVAAAAAKVEPVEHPAPAADLFSWGDSPIRPIMSVPTDEVEIGKGTLTRDVSEMDSKGGEVKWEGKWEVPYPITTNSRQTSWDTGPKFTSRSSTPDREGGHNRTDSIADADTSVISYASYQKYGVLGGEIGGLIDDGEQVPPTYDAGFGGPMSSGGGMHGAMMNGGGGYSTGIPEPTNQYMSIYPETQSDMSMAPTPKATSYNPMPGPKSHTKEELESVKSLAMQADQSFRAKSELVRKLSTDVQALESALHQAEAAIGGGGGEGNGGGGGGSRNFFGKKKAKKKEYEAAVEAAQTERVKVDEARAKLALAQREERESRDEMERLRQQYEEMEMEAATAQSMMTASGYQLPPQNQYNKVYSIVQDENGRGGTLVSAPASSDPYGMNVPTMATGGGGDYDNPFHF